MNPSARQPGSKPKGSCRGIEPCRLVTKAAGSCTWRKLPVGASVDTGRLSLVGSES